MSAQVPAPARVLGRTGRGLAVAGATYVLAWLVGLVAAPARPGLSGEAVLAGFVREHAGLLVVQSLLVHGIAGAALLVVAGSAGRALLSRGTAVTGAVSAVLSFTQVALLAAAVASAGRRADGAAAGFLAAVDRVDAVKLLALAGFAIASARAGRRKGALPGWAQVLGAVLAGLLVLGAASFVPGLGEPLGVVLFLALPVLLVYVGTVAVVVARHRSHTSGPEVSR